MAQRILVSFRSAVPADADAGARYLDRALAMKMRAEAHGATLCAWGALTFSFDFAPDDLEEAVNLATRASDGADSSPGFGVGLAEGEMRAVGSGGSLAALSWGLPLVRAVALSSAARAGEVLVDADFATRRAADLEKLGFRATGDSVKRLVAGATQPEVPEPPPSVEVTRPSTLRPPDPVADMARKALLQGDAPALERLTAKLRETGEHSDLVERMSGLVALRRGATADALRRLRAAAEAVKEPAQRARARLAYAVALASAGRTEPALLEALEALARAREAQGPQGEHACMLFLARLSAAAGHQDAASVWATLAQQSARATRPSIPPPRSTQ